MINESNEYKYGGCWVVEREVDAHCGPTDWRTRKGRPHRKRRSTAEQKGKVEKEEKEASAVFCPWLPLLLLSANQLDSVCAVDRPLLLLVLVLLPFCFCFPSSFNPLHIACFSTVLPSTILHIQPRIIV